MKRRRFTGVQPQICVFRNLRPPTGSCGGEPEPAMAVAISEDGLSAAAFKALHLGEGVRSDPPILKAG